jgi:hypothetical protein
MKAPAKSAILAMLATTGMAESLIRPNAESLAAVGSPLAVSMEEMREMKLAQRRQDMAAGVFDQGRYQLQDATTCSNGKAGEYSCNNIDLKGFLRHQDLGSSTRAGNDVWGKCSPSCYMYPLPLCVTTRTSSTNQVVSSQGGHPPRGESLASSAKQTALLSSRY